LTYWSNWQNYNPVNFGHQHMPPSFFGKACVSKNIAPGQNFLRAMVKHQPYFF
jgi:hypothetical protein